MKPAVLYVGGYSRSGSTLLDIVLGSHDLICGTGELSFLTDDWNRPSRLCTCGKRYSSCEFWGDLFPSGVPADVSRAVRVIEARGRLPALVRSALPHDVVKTYAHQQAELYQYIRDRSGKPIVLDSSKCARATAGRALALERLAGQRVFFLHLVRDGFATLRSYEAGGSNWVAEGFGRSSRAEVVRAGVGWTLSNQTASLLGQQFPGRSIRLRYEDFVSDPARALREVGETLQIDLSEIGSRVRQGARFAASHQVGGNRLRLASPVRVETGHGPPRSEVRWRHAVPFIAHGAYQQRKYGYPLLPRRSPKPSLGT